MGGVGVGWGGNRVLVMFVVKVVINGVGRWGASLSLLFGLLG